MERRAIVIVYTGEELPDSKKALLITALAKLINLDGTRIQTATYGENDLHNMIVKNAISPQSAVDQDDDMLRAKMIETEAATHAAIYIGQMFARVLQEPTNIANFATMFIKELCRCEDNKLKNAMEIVATKNEFIPVKMRVKYNLTDEVIKYIKSVYHSNMF